MPDSDQNHNHDDAEDTSDDDLVGEPEIIDFSEDEEFEDSDDTDFLTEQDDEENFNDN